MTAETRNWNPPSAAGGLASLSSGTLDWLAGNLDFFDPYSPDAGLPGNWKVKAALELALLCHVGSRQRPDDSRLREVARLLAAIWQRPDFVRRLDVPHPHYGRQYRLIYAALAPPGASAALRAAVLARLAAEQPATAGAESSYLRLETRYYADKAGLPHQLEAYEELFDRAFLLGRPPGQPVTGAEASDIVHALFYVSDFGAILPCRIRPGSREHLSRLIDAALDAAAREHEWDLAAELAIAQYCLGGDPLRSPQGAAAIASLARAQAGNGAIPGTSAVRCAPADSSPVAFFRAAYHATLVTALMSLIISSGRNMPDVP